VSYILYNLYCTVVHELNCQKRKKLPQFNRQGHTTSWTRRETFVYYVWIISLYLRVIRMTATENLITELTNLCQQLHKQKLHKILHNATSTNLWNCYTSLPWVVPYVPFQTFSHCVHMNDITFICDKCFNFIGWRLTKWKGMSGKCGSSFPFIYFHNLIIT